MPKTKEKADACPWTRLKGRHFYRLTAERPLPARWTVVALPEGGLRLIAPNGKTWRLRFGPLRVQRVREPKEATE